MKEYILDYERSKQMYEAHKNIIEMKMCYMNIWNIAVSKELTRDFMKGKLKVAYGAMPSVVNTMVRHCFIVDDKGNAIDPTVFSVPEREPEEKAVYIAHTVDKN